jgi:hypothetical protein
MPYKRLLVAPVCLTALLITGPSHAAPSEPNEGLSTQDVYEVYKARSLGTSLYSAKEYAEAYPHLLIAAKHGLKQAQAQVGFMHLHGLGEAKKDTRLAVGWLGVAAEGTSPREIDEVFDSLWERIPDDNRDSYEKLVDAFIARYGADANGVACRRVHKVGSQIREVRCMLTDRDGRELSDQINDSRADGSGGIGGVGGAPAGPRP